MSERTQIEVMGEEIASAVARGLMEAAAAGAAKFAREMVSIRRNTVAQVREDETNLLLAEAERIEATKLELKAGIRKATGLRKIALQRKLKEVEDTERTLVEAVNKEMALPNKPTLAIAN
jgi:hypothetical protein